MIKSALIFPVRVVGGAARAVCWTAHYLSAWIVYACDEIESFVEREIE